eukprot:4606796-Prymnesium_polylepis.1
MAELNLACLTLTHVVKEKTAVQIFTAVVATCTPCTRSANSRVRPARTALQPSALVARAPRRPRAA